MTQFAKYVVLLLAIFYWSISHFEKLYSWAGKNKIIPDDYRYGDLYRLSFLAQFKGKEKLCEDKIDQSKVKNNVHLYILGDSFADESNLNANNFEVEKYKYIHWDKPETIDFDKSAKNILIIESAERSAKTHFVKKSEEIQILQKENKQIPIDNFSIIKKLHNWVGIFSKNTQKTEERLWHTLLNYDFVLFFKEIKANLDLTLFERKSPNYVLAPNKNEIFYFEEADSNCPHSVLYTVTDQEIDGFVQNINETALTYKNMGFNEVYLSMIPNKATVLGQKLGDYNHVLQRIVNHKQLKVKTIDVYPALAQSKERVFHISDTHWNCRGSSIWQALVNEEIMKYNIIIKKP
jgi:hypothetical protein